MAKNMTRMKRKVSRISKEAQKLMMPENIYSVLKKDHDDARKIMKNIMESNRSQISLFQKLKNMLSIHMTLEEEHFYPVLENSKITRKKALQSYEEHNLARMMIVKIDDLDYDDEKWPARANVLSEIVMHHMKEEESKIFPMAKKLISRDEAKDMGRLILDEKMAMMNK